MPEGCYKPHADHLDFTEAEHASFAAAFILWLKETEKRAGSQKKEKFGDKFGLKCGNISSFI